MWRLADRIGAVIVTKDEDFARLRTGNEGGPQVVWIRLPNTRRVELLRWFEAALPEIKAALERGERLIEVV